MTTNVSMIARALSALGLMTMSEHERIVAENDNRAYDSWIRMINERDFYVDEYKALEAKFKLAATDLAKQAEEIAQMKVDMSRAAEAADNYLNWIAGLEAEVQALRPDAEAMRKKRAADRKRMAGKRGGSITAPKDGLVAINAEQVQP